MGGRTPPGAFRIALVIVAGLVALPAFAIGAQLDAALGVKGVIEASLGGGAILACVAVLAAIAGARSGLSTYALIINAFGTQGGKVVNFVLAAVLLGWFGVVLMMFASAASQGLESLGVRSPTLLWALAGAAVMTATALIGEQVRCFEVGMNDYMTKPFEFSDLYRRILALSPPVFTAV